jgi:hypothetical protein
LASILFSGALDTARGSFQFSRIVWCGLSSEKAGISTLKRSPSRAPSGGASMMPDGVGGGVPLVA